MTFTLKSIDPQWLHNAREIIARENSELQAGPSNTVELKGRRTGRWYRLMFGQPPAVVSFETQEDRDTALAMLLGKMELPPLPENDA